MTKLFRTGELFWLAPFACIGLITLAALRSPPVFPLPESSRIVNDAKGAQVAIPLPLKGVVGGSSDFLELTHAPEDMLKAGKPLDRSRFATSIISRIYPSVLKDDALWNLDDWTLEFLLAHDVGGVYFHYDSEVLRRFGLPAVTLGWKPKSRDDLVFTATRIANAALGQNDQGDARVAGYQQGFVELKQELQPDAVSERPRVLQMGSSATDWRMLWVNPPETTRFEQQEERLAVLNASEGHFNKGRQQDAERILTMDPDIIFEYGETVPDFLRDPRWQGLKAVREKRVYQSVRELRGSLAPLYGLDTGPIWAHWMAEIAHPDRVQTNIRELLRDHYLQAYGYRLSDAEIDDLLRVEENKNSAGYARFMKDNSVGAERGASR